MRDIFLCGLQLHSGSRWQQSAGPDQCPDTDCRQFPAAPGGGAQPPLPPPPSMPPVQDQARGSASFKETRAAAEKVPILWCQAYWRSGICINERCRIAWLHLICFCIFLCQRLSATQPRSLETSIVQSSEEARKCPETSMCTRWMRCESASTSPKKQGKLGQSLFFASGGCKPSLYSFKLRLEKKGVTGISTTVSQHQCWAGSQAQRHFQSFYKSVCVRYVYTYIYISIILIGSKIQDKFLVTASLPNCSP